MGDDRRTDERLLVATQDDANAFGVFYRRHAEAVLAYLLYRTRDPERALDLTAETFAIALASCRRFNPDVGPARGWLFGIAKNVLSDSRRRAASASQARERIGVQRLVFDDAELERVETLIDLERSELPLTELIGDLAADQRQAVVARIVEEREYSDISADLRVSEHTVRQRVSRGLARLQTLRERKVNEPSP